MANIDIPHGWKAHTVKSHPESSELVGTVAWFEHDDGAEIVVWEGEINDLAENERFQVEVRSPEQDILKSEGFEETEKCKAYNFTQSQMEMYPVQEVIKEN